MITGDVDVQAKLRNGSSIPHMGVDPEDVWEYVARGLRRRKYRDQAPRLINILKDRWKENETLEAIAAKNRLTKERVRQLEGKAINRMNELFADVGKYGIVNRLAWIEGNTADAVARHGGYVAVEEAERYLNWPKGSLRFWFLFNSGLGLLNQKAKNLRGDLELGRVTLTHESLSIAEGFKTENNGPGLSEIVQDIVGPKGIMRLGDVLATLDHRFGPNEDVTSAQLARGKALEARSGIVLLLSPERSESDTEIWVASGLSRAAREIARAMLYGPIEEDNISKNDTDERLAKGVRTDLISEWLDVHSYQKSNARAIEAVCARSPKVFARTGPTSWGLVGAGPQSAESEPSAITDVVNTVRTLLKTQAIVSKADVSRELSGSWSNAWLQITIALGLKDGYLINRYSEFQMPTGRTRYALDIGADLPESEKWRKRKAKPQQHGQLIQLVIATLKDTPPGLSENLVLRRVRDVRPDASADSVYVYLHHTLDDIVDILPNRIYRLKEHAIRELTEDLQGTLERYTQTSLQRITSNRFAQS
jgi:hypothetical protein